MEESANFAQLATCNNNLVIESTCEYITYSIYLALIDHIVLINETHVLM